jgi:hypothetical protein
MNLETLLAGLRAGDAQTRLQAARIIGTLDEVDALKALATQYKAETDPQAKEAIQWAGKRLKTAQDAGYSTLEAIIAFFHIDVEFGPVSASDDEQALLREVQYTMEMNEIRAQEAKAKNEAMKRIARGGILGLPGMMMAALPPTMSTLAGNNALSGRIELPPRRAMPTRPTDTNISILVRRLAEEAAEDKRARAATDLAQMINNPQALPHLADAFIFDNAPKVREAAQGAAKLIYWNAVYWEMEQDGSMAALINERASQQVDDSSVPDTAAEKPKREEKATPPAQADVGEILRKAEAARRKRKRR